jgi:hypothetical protein
MKLTELKIAPKSSWSAVSNSNPMICTVKLSSETATVETVLTDDEIHRVLDLVQHIVADAARRNVAEFVASVRQIEAPQVIE